MNQVLSTSWRDPGEATGQRPGFPGTGSILGAACPQPGPPGGETPSLQPAQLHGAPGGCRRGSEGWWGKWEVPGIKRLPSTPAGPRPSQFSGKKGFSPVPHEVSALGRSPLQFSGGRSWPPVPPTKQAQPLGASPSCFPSSVWVTPLPGLPAGQETGGAGRGACSPQLRATN